jgi:hypothetical protein
MAIKINDVFTRGGKPLIDFLEFCVLSVEMDPVCAFLILEYRREPTLPRALALYDSFCAARAPARVSVVELLPPKNLDLEPVISLARTRWQEFLNAEPDQERPVPRPTSPPRHMFDALAAGLRVPAARVGQRFDPDLAPLEQLPGGALNEGQRAFVENTWRRQVRPHLVSAGYRRIANIAG